MSDPKKRKLAGEFAAGKSEPDSSGPADRKYHLRYSLDSFLNLSREEGSALSGMVIEISDVGMSALVPEELEKGERVTLSFQLPLGSISIDGIVHYSHKFRHGFRFIDVTENQQRQLREACARLRVYCRDDVYDR